jgi:hypothetical protein
VTATMTEERPGRELMKPMAPAKGKPKRKPRAEVRQTGRDARALRWLAEMYGARWDLLRVLLARLGEDPSKTMVSDRAVREAVARWEQAGWVTRLRFYRETWVHPTRAGLRLANAAKEDGNGDPFEVWVPAATKLAHTHAAGVVRLAVEAAEPDTEWESERMIRRALASRHGKGHPVGRVPDGAAVLDLGAGRARYGIEVELHRKTAVRYERILRLYGPGWDRMVWFAPAGIAADLGELIRAAHRAALAGPTPYNVPAEVLVRPLPMVAGLDYGNLL